MNEVTVHITPEEAEVFDRVIKRLRDAAPRTTDRPHGRHYGSAMFEAGDFNAWCHWNTGDEGDGMPTSPYWDIRVVHSHNDKHCDGRRFRLIHPLRKTKSDLFPEARGPIHDDDIAHCPGCEACELRLVRL